MLYSFISYFYTLFFFILLNDFTISFSELFSLLTLFFTLFFSIILVLIPTINIIYSIVIFILIIVSSSLFIGSFSKFYFLSFAICLIYIGAISILFIFTLMILSVRQRLATYNHNIFLINIVVIFNIFYYIFSFIFFYNSSDFFVVDYTFLTLQIFKEYFFNYFYSNWNDLIVLGFYIFNYRYIEILILTFLLGSGLVASISIVASKSFFPKNQNFGFQLATDCNLVYSFKGEEEKT